MTRPKVPCGPPSQLGSSIKFRALGWFNPSEVVGGPPSGVAIACGGASPVPGAAPSVVAIAGSGAGWSAVTAVGSPPKSPLLFGINHLTKDMTLVRHPYPSLRHPLHHQLPCQLVRQLEDSSDQQKHLAPLQQQLHLHEANCSRIRPVAPCCTVA